LLANTHPTSYNIPGRFIKMAKYIIVVGGVISGTGKGVCAASMGLLMRLRGHSVQII
jgi:ATP:corrinoid adenosyltransferase